MKALFLVTFFDGKTFTGDLFQKEWNKIPDKPIKSIVFDFFGKEIILKDPLFIHFLY